MAEIEGVLVIEEESTPFCGSYQKPMITTGERWSNGLGMMLSIQTDLRDFVAAHVGKRVRITIEEVEA